MQFRVGRAVFFSQFEAVNFWTFYCLNTWCGNRVVSKRNTQRLVKFVFIQRISRLILIPLLQFWTTIRRNNNIALGPWLDSSDIRPQPNSDGHHEASRMVQMETSEQDSTQNATVERSEDQFTRVSVNKTLFAELLRSINWAAIHTARDLCSEHCWNLKARMIRTMWK